MNLHSTVRRRGPLAAAVASGAILLLGCGSPTAAVAPTATALPAIPASVPASGAGSPSSGVSVTSLLGSPAPGASAAPASAPASGSAGGVTTFTNANFGAVVDNPTKFKGQQVQIKGQVFYVETNATQVAFQMWTDPYHGLGNTAVRYDKTAGPLVKKGDQVTVTGALLGEMTATSTTGQVLHLPKVEASNVQIG